MHAGCVRRSIGFIGLCLVLLTPPASASERRAAAPAKAAAVERVSRLQLQQPLLSIPTISMLDSFEVLTCFDSTLTELINPGCFAMEGGGGGDCNSTEEHFLAQFFDPFDYLGDFTGTWRIREIAFISNDGDTVWPSIGIILRPFTDVGFPSPQELQTLQAKDIASAGDLGEVIVDMRPYDLEFTVDNIFYLALQFPAGSLAAATQGPGILADDQGEDFNCDFLTQDAGATWLGRTRTTTRWTGGLLW